MIIETLENDEISISQCETGTDGIYIPIRRFAYEMDVPESLVRVWKCRGSIEAVTIFGQIFVKKGCQILKRRATDMG